MIPLILIALIPLGATELSQAVNGSIPQNLSIEGADYHRKISLAKYEDGLSPKKAEPSFLEWRCEV